MLYIVTEALKQVQYGDTSICCYDPCIWLKIKYDELEIKSVRSQPAQKKQTRTTNIWLYLTLSLP